MSQGHIMRAYERAGMDLSKQKVRFDVSTGFMQMNGDGSGIKVNMYCESNIPGLFACGQAGGYPANGTTDVGGLNLPSCFVTGYRAGEYAARYVKEGGEIKIDDNQVKSLQKAALKPLKAKKGVKAVEIRGRWGDFMSQPRMAFFRHEKRMKEALAELENCEAMLPDLWAENPHEFVKANGIKSYLQVWRFSLIASRERKESRGPNLREDYPFTDNVNYLKWFLLARKNNDVEVKVGAIPIYRWPVKPERYEMVPHPVKFPKVGA